MAKKCSGCGADVEWVTTTANRKMPLNLGPALDGNIILTEAGRAQALGPIELAALPPGTVDTLLKPENKDMLVKILTAHVVAGKFSAADIARKAKASKDGYFNMVTLSGDALSAKMKGDTLYVYDESGQTAQVTIADVNQSNGVIFVVNKVLLPK